MRKRAVLVLVLAVLAMVAFIGCHKTEQTTTTPTTTTVTTVPTVVQEFSSLEEIPEEVVTTTTTNSPDTTYQDYLEELVRQEFRLGFGAYGLSVKVDGKVAKVTHVEGWNLDKMFVRNQFLDEHEVGFSYVGSGALERYTPEVKEPPLQGDDWGVATPEEIATRTAIRGFDGGTLTIVIDGEFTIIVNPPDTTEE